MADCPGVLHLAFMADGGLARIRVPGGELSAPQARAVADAARRLGSGAIDLTNRANLQIRGLRAESGPELARTLDAAGLLVEGPADRRRNILLDPLSGLDPKEACDLRPFGRALERGLKEAPWIERLSPKFSFVLDGGGASCVAATPSDISVRAVEQALFFSIGGRLIGAAATAADGLRACLSFAEAAANIGHEARARDLTEAAVAEVTRYCGIIERSDRPWPEAIVARFGAIPAKLADRIAMALPAPVGRLTPAMLDWAAEASESEGEGRIVLAPWSAVILPGVAADAAAGALKRSEAAGFTPVPVAQRLTVIACAGAPACPRASEPAKALGLEVLALASREPGRLPEGAARVHLSACAKGCAGSAPADLLLLGSGEPGWSVHHHAAPRSPGPSLGRIGSADAASILELVADRR